MDMLSKVAVALFAAFLCFITYKYIRSNPEALTWKNINKSMFSMGILAVGLIAFLGIVVWLLRQS